MLGWILVTVVSGTLVLDSPGLTYFDKTQCELQATRYNMANGQSYRICMPREGNSVSIDGYYPHQVAAATPMAPPPRTYVAPSTSSTTPIPPIGTAPAPQRMAAAPQPRAPRTTAYENKCAGERIDNSTSTDARRRMEGAGYIGVRYLKKGCDNFWHAKASERNEVNIVLSPQGQIMRETD